MSGHPCHKGPDGAPCRRIRLGQPYDLRQDCRLCWLFAHHVRYNLAWGGDGQVTAPPAPVLVAATSLPVKPFQLGDMIESALTKVGVTKARVEQWLGRSCGCTERQKRLNELSAWAQQVGQETIAKARDWLSRLMGGT